MEQGEIYIYNQTKEKAIATSLVDHLYKRPENDGTMKKYEYTVYPNKKKFFL